MNMSRVSLLFTILFVSGISCIDPTSSTDDSFFDSPAQTIDQFLGRPSTVQSFNSTSQGAATGDASADTGSVQSNQTSSQTNTAHGNVFNSASRGSGQGTNIRISGASQAGGQGLTQVGSGALRQSNKSTSSQNIQSNSQGASTGDASANSGTIQSDQTSSQVNTAQGSTIDTGNVADGQGVNISLSGASQVGGDMGFQRLRKPADVQSFNAAGQGASTGDATADMGSAQSDQTSSQKNSQQGAEIISSSRGSGQGTNIRISGSSQAKSQGVSQEALKAILGQSKSRLTPGILNSGFDAEDDDNIVTPIAILTQLTRRPKPARPTTTTPKAVEMFQSDGSAVSIGDGTADSGTVDSSQKSSLVTNSDGTSGVASSVGRGSGTNIRVNGGVQSDSSGIFTLDESGALIPVVKASTRGRTGQAQGNGAASGDAVVGTGTASSVQNSQVNTDSAGSSVLSASNDQASGTGVRVSGSASAGGGGQNMQQWQSNSNNNFNNNNFNNGGGFWQPQSGQTGFGPGFGPPMGMMFGTSSFGMPFRTGFMRSPGPRLRFRFPMGFG